MIPDISLLDRMLAGETADSMVLTLRDIGEMRGSQDATLPKVTGAPPSWINLNRRISWRTPAREGLFAYVPFRAMRCRCHRGSVSGVTMVATAPRARRPSRYPRTTSRRRSSSVSGAAVHATAVEGSDALP